MSVWGGGILTFQHLNKESLHFMCQEDSNTYMAELDNVVLHTSASWHVVMDVYFLCVLSLLIDSPHVSLYNACRPRVIIQTAITNILIFPLFGTAGWLLVFSHFFRRHLNLPGFLFICSLIFFFLISFFHSLAGKCASFACNLSSLEASKVAEMIVRSTLVARQLLLLLESAVQVAVISIAFFCFSCLDCFVF